MSNRSKELIDMLHSDKKELSELIDKIKATVTKNDKIDQAAIMAVGEVLSSLYRSKIDVNNQLIRLFLSNVEDSSEEEFHKMINNVDYNEINMTDNFTDESNDDIYDESK